MTDLPSYTDLLARVAESWSDTNPLCLFTTHQGAKWNGELLVCGRATNGFDPSWTTVEASTSAGRQQIVDTTLARRADAACPLAWVADCWRPDADYNTARSAFWRATRGIASLLEVPREESTWSSYLGWTNLYRVAPADAGNPRGKLKRVQFEWCRDRLINELDELRPKRLVFMTGSDWAGRFVEAASIAWRPSTQLVEGAGKWRLASGHTIDVVVAKHPERKPGAPFISGVVEAFAQIA